MCVGNVTQTCQFWVALLNFCCVAKKQIRSHRGGSLAASDTDRSVRLVCTASGKLHILRPTSSKWTVSTPPGRNIGPTGPRPDLHFGPTWLQHAATWPQLEPTLEFHVHHNTASIWVHLDPHQTNKTNEQPRQATAKLKATPKLTQPTGKQGCQGYPTTLRKGGSNAVASTGELVTGRWFKNGFLIGQRGGSQTTQSTGKQWAP